MLGLFSRSSDLLLHNLRLRSFCVFPFNPRRSIMEAPRTGHDERTFQEPRSREMHRVVLDEVHDVNHEIRTYRLNISNSQRGIQEKSQAQEKFGACEGRTRLHRRHLAEILNHLKFYPGQWLDVHIPGLSKPGGFTITSIPSAAAPCDSQTPHICLAVQKSLDNPAAKWLWGPADSIIGKELAVRVGGSFVWPPKEVDQQSIDNLIFVAGGVGINPLISMLRHLLEVKQLPTKVTFFYSTKVANEDFGRDGILFLPQLIAIDEQARTQGISFRLELFVTSNLAEEDVNVGFPFQLRRLTTKDLLGALRAQNLRQGTVCYICGPPDMTDEFVEFFGSQEGMQAARILCEKWW